MKNAFPAFAFGLASVFSVTVLSTPASAEDKKAAPIHVRGSIVDYQGSTLKVKTREGETIDVALVLRSAELLTLKAQRLLEGRDTLAREFDEKDISPSFRVNGTSAPDSEEYAELLEDKFSNWRLKIDGHFGGLRCFRLPI